MAEGGKYQKTVLNFHIHTSQDGDTRIENKTETQIIDSAIKQLNIQQEPNNDAADDLNNGAADTNDDAAEDPNNVVADDSIVQDEIIQNVENMNLPSSVPISVECRGKVTLDPGRFVSYQTKDNENRGGKHNSLRCELLRVQAATLCRESKFREAESILEEISRIQQEDVGVSALLLIAEVSIQLGRKQEAKKAIADIVRLSMTSPSDVEDVFRRASDLIVDKSYVCAIVLLRISSGMYKLHPSLSPDDIVGGIYKCVSKIDGAVKPMIESGDRSKIIASDYGLPYMMEMVDDLRAVINFNPISMSKNAAICLNLIGGNYNFAKKYEKGIDSFKSGLDVTECQFGNNSSKYKVYGCLLYNLGCANFSLGRYSIAKDCYMNAIVALNDATDFSNDDEKQKYIKVVRNSMKSIRKNLK